MSATAAALVKAAILALTDENTRKKIGWVLAAILSPVIDLPLDKTSPFKPVPGDVALWRKAKGEARIGQCFSENKSPKPKWNFHRPTFGPPTQGVLPRRRDSGSIFFTSGGTESDNWALKAVAELRGGKGRHIITSAIEHHAILHTLEHLEKAQGFSVTYLPVDSLGRVDPQAVKAAIRPDTILITVMAANNEIGTIEPIAEIAAIAREAGVLFHTDAVQAVGHIPVDVSAWNCDMLSLSGHKFHGPRGVGALYVRRGLRLPPLIHGGGQEKGRRSGTENVAGAVGLAAALREAVDGLEARSVRLAARRDRLIDREQKQTAL